MFWRGRERSKGIHVSVEILVVENFPHSACWTRGVKDLSGLQNDTGLGLGKGQARGYKGKRPWSKKQRDLEDESALDIVGKAAGDVSGEGWCFGSSNLTPPTLSSTSIYKHFSVCTYDAHRSAIFSNGLGYHTFTAKIFKLLSRNMKYPSVPNLLYYRALTLRSTTTTTVPDSLLCSCPHPSAAIRETLSTYCPRP